MSNPYNRDSIIGRAYDVLNETGAPISVTSLAGLTGDSYSALYNAISKDIAGVIELQTVDGMRSAVLVETALTAKHGDAIRDTMQGEKGMAVAEIAKQSGVPAPLVVEFIGQQTRLENIDITPASSPANYKYEWVGPVRIEAAFEHETPIDDVEALTKLEQAIDSEPVVTHETSAPESTPEKARFMVLLEGEVHWFADKDTAYECLKTRARYGHPAIIAHVSKALNVIVEPTVVELEPVEPWIYPDANKSA